MGAFGKRFGHRLTPQEEEIIEVSFNSFADERGLITSAKLVEAFKNIGAESAVKDIELLIADMDEDGDGVIDKVEYHHIMSRKFLGEDDDASFMHAFEMLDDNKDGFIPLVEFRNVLMKEGRTPLSEQEVDELLFFADTDADGLIDYRNFLGWLEKVSSY